MNNEKLLRDTELAALLGVSVRQLRNLTAGDGFPRSVKIGKRSVRWRYSEVIAYIGGL